MKSAYRVLVVEDKDEYLNLIEDCLNSSNNISFQFDIAKTLDKTLSLIDISSYDVILCDLGLPDSRGIQTVESLITTAKTTPIVVLTECDDELIGVEALRKGAQDYLIKNPSQIAILPRILSYAIERKKIEQKAIDLANLKSKFTSMVSHELKTPLTVIQECLAIISENKNKLDKESVEFIDVAQKNVERLSRLIHDVLDYQKINTGKVKFNFNKNRMSSLMEDVISTMKTGAKQKGIELNHSCPKDSLPVIFDRDKLGQVLINLIDNAVKFTESGSVSVFVDQNKDRVEISVKDTGCGIKEEDMQKLFQSFSQIDTKINEDAPRGSGLGLAIAKEIVEAHHGKIWANSTYGEGSVFSFSIPVDPE